MYVDDVLCVADTKNVERMLEEIQNLWQMTITGILVRDGHEPRYSIPMIERFLGCTIETGKSEEGKPIIKLHQIGYIKEKLKDRALDKTQGRCGLPDSMEGRVEPVTDRTTPEYLEAKKKCQEDVGALLWISTRARPDITCSISLIATLIVFHPWEAFNLIRAVWRYRAATSECYHMSKLTTEK